MGCQLGKVHPVNELAIQRLHNERTVHNDHNSTENAITTQQNILPDNTTISKLTGANDHVEIQVADLQAFNSSFVQQRQQAIDNRSYRSTIETWQPSSLPQLTEIMKAISRGKSLIDCHWIIFYWIACNIKYDTVSFFTKNYEDQSAEGVFRTKKGVCAGYANLYKYLCDQLTMPCEVVSGYAKGYGFDDREGAPSETDHAWNVVEIDHHWYLMESTWGTGHLNEQKTFERKLNSYYFLSHPNEMIYDHLPEEHKWQLLRTPIKMTQYMQMPKFHPAYFELKLELVSPRNQAHVDLVPDKPYELVLIRAPSDVHLMANLKLKDQKIDGGHRVIFDHQKELYCCYFAPSNIGKHKITIYGKQGVTESTSYSEVLDLTLDVKQIPSPPLSYPETWQLFHDLGLKIEAPQNRANVVWPDNASYAEVLIQAADDIELSCSIEYQNNEIKNGSLAQYDKDKKLWQLLFAPEQAGPHKLIVYAKRRMIMNRHQVLS